MVLTEVSFYAIVDSLSRVLQSSTISSRELPRVYAYIINTNILHSTSDLFI